MTIALQNVMKRVRLGGVRVTYDDLNIKIESAARVAFLGHKEAGMESVLRLICAADAPDRGTVTRNHSISWPIPDTSFVQTHLTVAANARFIARLYETHEPSFLARVAELGDLGPFMNLRVDRCPGEVRMKLGFMAGVSLPFDQYIVTNANVGKKDDRSRTGEIIDELRQRAGLLLVGSDAKAAKQYCDEAYVFDEGQATHFDDIDAAVERFGEITAKNLPDEDDEEADSELQSLVSDDF